MSAPDPLIFLIDEQTTGRYTSTIVDNDGVTPVSVASLLTMVLTVYAIKSDGTDGILRGPQQNVLNTNNVTIDVNGSLIWTVQSGDTTMVEGIPFEDHYCLFEWTWATVTSAGTGRHVVILRVRNLRRVGLL
jgi:hypothetical protein